MLPQYGIGLTDVAKFVSGADVDLRPQDFDAAALRCKIERYAPRVLAFDSKNAARAFYRTPKTQPIAYGRQGDAIGATVVFVLPSTSGAASGFWDVAYWQALADFLAAGSSDA